MKSPFYSAFGCGAALCRSQGPPISESFRQVITPFNGNYPRKTIEKPQENGGFMGFDGNYRPAIKHSVLENGPSISDFPSD